LMSKLRRIATGTAADTGWRRIRRGNFVGFGSQGLLA
jgi:hypothetical protein